MLAEAWMIGKVQVFSMFKNKHTFFFENPFLEYQVGNVGNFWQSVGWVGKDKVELLSTTLHKAEHIASQGNTLVGA